MNLEERRAALHRHIDQLSQQELEQLEQMLHITTETAEPPSAGSGDGLLGYSQGKPFRESDLEDRFRQADEEEARGELLTVDEAYKTHVAWRRNRGQ